MACGDLLFQAFSSPLLIITSAELRVAAWRSSELFRRANLRGIIRVQRS